MHAGFLTHANKRWLWVALALLLACVLAYAFHEPVAAPPNGGTWLGYTLGTIGALLIFWLMWFGVRKRRYGSRSGPLRGWLSAHVYLGTALVAVALLHSGFQFGWNVHTAALVLMLAVILSGFYGVYTYLRYPALMTRNRDSASREAMIEEIAELDQNALSLADLVSPKIHAIVLRSIENTRLGGGDKQAETLRRRIDVMTRKKNLASRIARDIQLQALMEIWLYLHVPLSFALLAALLAHVISVFFYW